MYRRISMLIGIGVLSVMLAQPAPATAEQAMSRSVAVTRAPKDVTDGNRFAVTVRVGSAAQAKTVQIQQRTTDVFGDSTWTTLKSRRVQSTSKQTFKLVASGVDVQKFRARATYRSGPAVNSPAFAITVWHWTELSSIPSYYSTYGIWDYANAQFGMNGDQWIGWFTWGSYGMWESRYTTGRNCKAFRGTFGVTDDSADGSSGTFTLLTDESTTVYESPTLVPGAVEKVQFAIAKPYRFSIQARNTSEGDLRSYPAIGDPQFLCNTAY